MDDPRRRSQRYYDRAAIRWDLGTRFVALLRGHSDANSRREAVRHLDVKPGDRVLEVAPGTGLSLPFIAERIGPTGSILGLDISLGMLRRCQQRVDRCRLNAALAAGDAGSLPFVEGVFDAVFHHGGLAEFPNKKGAIQEMMRVARPGATVVICDVGRPPDRRLPLVSRLLLRLQPLYDCPPPLDLISPDAHDIQVTWFRGGSWYLIEFEKPLGGGGACQSSAPPTP